ncbi:DUF6541 family protein [Arthrobacter sp. TMS2-4]
MSWADATPVAAAMLACLFLPGLAVAMVGRLRGLAAIALAPALSLGLGGVGALALGFIAVPWSLWSYLGFSAVAVLVLAILVRVPLGGRRPPPGGDSTSASDADEAREARGLGALRGAAPFIGVLMAGVVSFAPLRDGMRKPDFPALTWDSVFHHSAVRYIIETGNGSSLDLGGVSTTTDKPRFYPGAWHDLVSLTVGQFPITVSLNVAALLMACVVWPLSMAYLARVAFPRLIWMPLLAPVVASGFVAFPARMISYGTVWPAAMGTALVPALIALILMVTAPGATRASRVHLSLLLVVALAGATLCHPTAPIAAVFLSLPILVYRYAAIVAATVERGTKNRAAALIAVPVFGIALACVAVMIVPRIRSVFFFKTDAVGPATDAVGAAIFDTMLMPLGHGNSEPFWIGGLLALAGVVMTLALREYRWASASWAISIVLYTVAAGEETVLRPLVGLWYSDPVRLGGLVPIFTSLLASYAVLRTIDALVSLVARSRTELRRPAVAPAMSLVLLVGIAAPLYPQTDSLRTNERTDRLSADYWQHLEWDGGIASLAELEFIERISAELPDDAVVLGDPTSGAALVYSLGKTETLFRTMSGSRDADARYLGRHFNDIDTDPRICRLLTEYGVTHFYDDDSRYLPDIVHRKDMEGLTTIGVAPETLQLIDDSGDGARIYEIEACGP